MRKICVITATRAEYGLLYPLLKLIKKSSDFELQLIVSGTHLDEEYGSTKGEILEDGFEVDQEIPIINHIADSTAVSKNMAEALIGGSEYLVDNKPDIAVILGDRYEMMGFALALVNQKIPIAHINGGEITQGSLDDIYRNCITKMSTLHFTNCDDHRRRVIQMGENPNKVYNVGDICIDNIMNEKLMSLEELQDSLKISLIGKKIAIITYHPVSTEKDVTEGIDSLLEAMSEYTEILQVYTKANADFGGNEINKKMQNYVQNKPNTILVDSLGRRRFLSLLSKSIILIGNSSSGIYEAPCFHVPTVNVGKRQSGRLHGETVIDCRAEKECIMKSIEYALSNDFQKKCRKYESIFGNGNTAEQIMNIIRTNLEKGISCNKLFYDIPVK